MWGVSFFFLDGSNISVPFMLLIHARACSCKISISERGDFYILFLFFFFSNKEKQFKKVSQDHLLLSPISSYLEGCQSHKGLLISSPSPWNPYLHLHTVFHNWDP